VKRRDFLGGAAGALALPARRSRRSILWMPLVRALANGAPVRKGKVTLVLPQLADNGNSASHPDRGGQSDDRSRST